MSKKRIFIIQPRFELISPRTIRIRNIFKYLTDEYEIHILKFQHPDKTQKLDNCTFHTLKLSSYYSTFINGDYSSEKYLSSRNIIPRIIAKIYRDYICFPDVWSSTHNQVINYCTSLKTESFDLILVPISPFSTAQLATRLKSLSIFKHSKILLDIGDPLNYNAARLGTSSEKKRDFEKKHLNVADGIIVTNQLTKEHYLSEYKIEENKISVIPQGVDTKLFSCDRKELNPGMKLTMCYAGIFYKKLRSPAMFFKALEKYNGKTNYEVKLFGSNFNTKSNNVIKYDRISQKQLSLAYKESHFLLFFDNAFGIQISGKLFELLATKKPILFIYNNPDSEALGIVNNYSHVVKTLNNENDILDALNKLPDLLKTIKKPSYSIENLSWEGRASKYKRFLSSII